MRLRSPLLILLGAALVAAALLQEGLRDVSPESQKTLELKLSNFTLASLRVGEEAKKELVALHGGAELQLEDALIAEYIAEDGRLVKVWVGVAQNESVARELLARMHTGLGSSRLFSPDGSVEVGEVQVFRARGMGEVHYYYARGNRVVWVSGLLSEQELASLVENF